MGNKKFDFNISYSAKACYGSCQRTFYYGYIAKVQGKESIRAYGDAGGVVHTVLEMNYYKSVDECKVLFEELWTEAKLDSTNKGFGFRLVNKDPFWNSVLNGLNKKYDIVQTEEKIQFEEDFTIKGFIDVVVKYKPEYTAEFLEKKLITESDVQKWKDNPDIYDDTMIVDWKTNSNSDEGQVHQLRFYAYLWYRKYGKLPRLFLLDYIKISKQIAAVFTMEDVKQVSKDLQEFVNDLYSKESFKDWAPSPDGVNTNFKKGACLWCAHQARCKDDMIDKEEEHFKLVLKKGKIYFANPLTSMFEKVIDKYFSYDVPNKDFVIQAVKAKTGRDWDGVKHLFSRNTLPIGFLNKLKYYISLYGDATKKHCTIEVFDERHKFQEVNELPNKLKDIELRYYQGEAADKALREKSGIIAVPTSGGKTVIAAEIWRRKPTNMTFVVDRKVLLSQTVEEFERVLDLKGKIGTIEAGSMNITDTELPTGTITVATIQTINARLKKNDKEMIDFLKNQEMIITDECHIAKASQYDNMYSNAPNAKYRFGLTGTPPVDDCNYLELTKNIGFVIYTIPIQTLIEEGTVMKPIIQFVKYDSGFIMEGNFNDMQEQLLENEERNLLVKKIVGKHKGNVIMILVHRIAHGRLLEEQLKADGHETFFIQGSVPNELREDILKDAREGHSRVLIGTSSIVSKGLNLKSLQVVINATGNATSIMTIQSLGRVLRTDEGKKSAHFYDFDDDIKFFDEHTEQRINAFKKEGHEVSVGHLE